MLYILCFHAMFCVLMVILKRQLVHMIEGLIVLFSQACLSSRFPILWLDVGFSSWSADSTKASCFYSPLDLFASPLVRSARRVAVRQFIAFSSTHFQRPF